MARGLGKALRIHDWPKGSLRRRRKKRMNKKTVDLSKKKKKKKIPGFNQLS